MTSPTALEIIDGADRAATILHPIRMQLLERLTEPDSASGLARQLGLPRQNVNYHLRQLEQEGLVELVEERRKGNCMERVVRATARSYLITPGALGSLAADPSRVGDHFSAAYLVAVAARAIQDVALLRQRAEEAKKRLATLTLQADVRFASAADQHAFSEELANAIAQLIAKYHDDRSRSGRSFRVFLGAYPAVAEQAHTRPRTAEER